MDTNRNLSTRMESNELELAQNKKYHAVLKEKITELEKQLQDKEGKGKDSLSTILKL